MKYEIKKAGKFTYIEEGNGEVLMLLHGLFGALSNFEHTIEAFKQTHKVVIPMLPIFECDLKDANIEGYAQYVYDFVELQQYKQMTLLGNSLGGHITLVFTHKHPSLVKSMILTASSGLYESALGETFPQRGNYDYIKQKTELTFYNPTSATKELVDEVFEIVNNREKAIRVIYTARSAMHHNMKTELPNMHLPSLLIWGNQDTITPPFVAKDFNTLLPNSELHFIDHCGHAPMMEQPEKFNQILKEFVSANS
jgi:pimeloyl-ACP methyl ester carboxylesterase